VQSGGLLYLVTRFSHNRSPALRSRINFSAASRFQVVSPDDGAVAYIYVVFGYFSGFFLF